MRQGQQRAPLRRTLLLLLILWAYSCIFVYAQELHGQEDKKFGDKCSHSSECGFHGSVCDDRGTCSCGPELPITNHYDRCGIAVKVNESCYFNEQCEALNVQTTCKEGVCACRYQKQAILRADGQVECIEDMPIKPRGPYVDPAMIGILVAMFLMFITICVVLRLFSKARWRENRTIFNTPNPRLMNASLLKENKHPHDRRGSRTSRGPSRQPSIVSLRADSPNSQGSHQGSRGSSNASVASTRANKSPHHIPVSCSAATPMLENVTVEIQELKE